jgi:hypothetical protein
VKPPTPKPRASAGSKAPPSRGPPGPDRPGPGF